MGGYRLFQYHRRYPPVIMRLKPEPKTESTEEEMRPIAIHVESITYDASLSHTYRRRVAVVDLELSAVLVEDLLFNLKKRLDDRGPGSIRIRFKGRMVLE